MQKTKFIVLISLMCFVFLLFIQEEAFSAILCTKTADRCKMVRDPETGVTEAKCEGYKETCTDSGNGSNGGGNGGGSHHDDDEGWNCQPDGSCVYDRQHGSYSTEAQCKSVCKPHGTYNICRKPYIGSLAWLNGNANTMYCKSSSWTGTKPADQCQIDSDCRNGGAPSPTKYDCNKNTYQCYQTSSGRYASLSECQNICVKPSGTTSCPGSNNCYACNKTTYQCYQNKNGVYSTLSMCQNHCRKPSTSPTTPPTIPPTTEPPQCKISNFDIPDMMWVGYPRTAEWSTNEVCTEGKITCRLSDETDCGDREDLSSDDIPVGYDQDKSFIIYQPGYYQYEFEACGPNNCDTWGDGSGAGEPTELPIIRAINLPIWQEINPVLPKDTE